MSARGCNDLELFDEADRLENCVRRYTSVWARLAYGLVTEWQGAARQFTMTLAGLDNALGRKRREAPKCCEDQPPWGLP